MKRLLVGLMLLLAVSATKAQAAFDSTTTYNSVNMSYTSGSTISQTIVFNNTMRSGGTIVFNVDAHAGGGRPLEHDTGNLRVEFYTANGTLISTNQTNYSQNLLQMNAWSSGPGDNSAPWQNLSLSVTDCGGSCANVGYMKVYMVGTDASWWAGNYGPQWRLPSVTFNSGNNLLYNPEFGSYSGTYAQGWTSSTGWGACGTVSGSVACSTTATGVTANMSGGGYSATGGTTSGTAGGYTSNLSATNPTGVTPSAGLAFITYAAGGPTPSRTGLTKLSSGIASTVNFNWGGGQVANSGRADGVVIRYYGYFRPPYTGTYYFGTTTDDGSILSVNGVTVINAWREQGPTFWQTNAVTLTKDQVVPIEFWYYENGGGAVAMLYWYNPTLGNWEIIPSTLLATTSDFWAADIAAAAAAANPYCCGGSAAQFNVNAGFDARATAYMNTPNHGAIVNIEQIGNNNTINITQRGSPNNYIKYYANGSSNQLTSSQTSTTTTAMNYTELTVNGSNNVTDLSQTSTGGNKGIYATVANGSNSVTVQQKDNGSHYAEISLTGGNKTVNLTQEGSAGQMASITLSGGATSITTTQSGATQQFYSINYNCATASCAAITVTQGQK